jgi:hypothetical protein
MKKQPLPVYLSLEGTRGKTLAKLYAAVGGGNFHTRPLL